MKNAHLLIAIPVFVFLALSGTLDLGALLPSYPGYDYTPYLAARSLAKDLDLACGNVDSDRFFLETGQRPSHFRVADRRVLFSDGRFQTYAVFYVPDLFVYLLAPFAGLLGFHGWLLFHALLILCMYLMGYCFYRNEKDDDGTLPAFNVVFYFTLIPLPALFLLPTHHLYLLALVSAALFFGLRGWPVASALLLGLAFSTQPWSLLVAVLLIGYWQYSGLRSEFLRFVPVLAVSVAAAWGLEFLMYPRPDVSNIRWVTDPLDSTLAALKTAVPEPATSLFAMPSLQRVSDFLFGRSIGLFVYGTAAGCLLLSSLWLWRDRIVNRTLVFVVLLLVTVACTPVETWGIYGFASDLWILICATVFFAVPAARPRTTLILTALLAGVFSAPILVNPLGAWTSRDYYLQSIPYRWMPSELSLVGRHGLTSDADFQFAMPEGKFYFLNDQFYPEKDFFWVHGESTLEFLFELGSSGPAAGLQIINGAEPSRVSVRLGNREEEFHLQPQESAFLELSRYAGEVRRYEGRSFLHGTITTSSGFVPKLLSRENPDFRYLGCQVRFAVNHSGK